MSKKSWIIIGLLIVILIVIYLDTPNKQDTLIQDMVVLDRNYIPALAMTSQEKLAPAKQAIARLLPVWSSFMEKHQEMEKRDSGWSQDMSRINQYIHEADGIITNGKDLKGAHDALEHVRIIMMNARDRNHIDYYIDGLTRFHEPMETLVLSVKDKQPSELTDETLASMRAQLGTAQYLWQQVVKVPFDKAVFGFSDEKSRKLEQLLSAESQGLAYLGEALDSGEKAAIIKAGMAIKPPFAQVFMMFGNFDMDNKSIKNLLSVYERKY